MKMKEHFTCGFFDDHETVPSLPGAYERVRQPMMIHVRACLGSVGGCFDNLL